MKMNDGYGGPAIGGKGYAQNPGPYGYHNM